MLVYLDSSIVIYLVERHPVYAAQIEGALAETGKAVLATSPLVRLESLVKPGLDGRSDIVDLYEQFFKVTRQLSINDETFDRALQLRVDHRLKTPDALHLATAQQHGCDLFWTNDNRLAGAAGDFSAAILTPPAAE